MTEGDGAKKDSDAVTIQVTNSGGNTFFLFVFFRVISPFIGPHYLKDLSDCDLCI